MKYNIAFLFIIVNTYITTSIYSQTSLPTYYDAFSDIELIIK